MPINLGMVADAAAPAPERARQDNANAGTVFPHICSLSYTAGAYPTKPTQNTNERNKRTVSLLTMRLTNYFINM